ncbi:AAA family ATPase [Massilia sp. DWR3-1-1]|uniref:AAA family ATPase n=1 Tax=Massilia sp. DWR3-1-1 TaxID=2804559 RepID=UPI003CF302F6
MDFEIPESLVKPLLGAIAADSPLARRLGEFGACHGDIVVPSALFDAAALNTLYALSKTGNERALMFQMLALDNIYNAPQARPIPALDQLVPGLVAYLARDLIDGWLYRRNKDGTLLPWLVQRLRYVEPDQGRPYVVVDLLANTMDAANAAHTDPAQRRSGMSYSLVINRHDIVNRSIPALLAEFGFYKECAEFKREYEGHAALFVRYQPRFGAQFVARHGGFVEDDGARGQLQLRRIAAPGGARCVNDEALLERRFDTASDADFWRAAGIGEGFERIPLHCYIHLFHLEWHRAIRVHVQHLQPYQYRPALRDKLVLPSHHRDLIDILTANLDVFTEDVVPGKSGGTTILCQGAPGLGKTLTAEIYAEVVGKPLYRVHSGQLGTTAASVGATLTGILHRAMRWQAIILLDEADVYIRRRDNDLEHNAIVAEFLRTLEYFDGLLFMTTNRSGDVDDAILSRCIATICYETPTQDDALRLWKLLGEQFGAALTDELIEALSGAFPHASGRDIKELLKLATRYCKAKNLPLSEPVFRLCARFRGQP